MTKIWHTANLVGFILNYSTMATHFLASIQVATTLLRHKFNSLEVTMLQRLLYILKAWSHDPRRIL